VGYMMGVDEELLPDSAKEAFYLERTISERQFCKSNESIALTNSIMEDFITLYNFQGEKKMLIPAYMRFLLGPEVSDLLSIPPLDLIEILKDKNYSGISVLNLQNSQRNVVFKSNERILAQFNLETKIDEIRLKFLTK
jgi:hypothetical protein